MIVQMRIDERLTHGQVCSTWINTLGATHVLVPNDQVANDEFQKNIMSMGIPSNVKALFTTLDKAVDILNSPKANNAKMFVVIKTPKDALYIVEHTQGIEEVNIANYGSIVQTGKKIEYSIGRFVLLDEDDVAYVKGIKEKVKNVFHQDIVGSSVKKIAF